MITESLIQGFCDALFEKEYAAATIQKYTGTIRELKTFAGEESLTKSILLSFREVMKQKYRAQTVNGKLSAINVFLDYTGLSDMRLKFLRVQKRAFLEESRELSRTEYRRLLDAAKDRGNDRLYHVMLAICVTGIRISELKYITVETVKSGRAEISMKGKERLLLIPKALKNKLLQYAARNKIFQGCLFITKNKKPLDRSNIWHDMKKLCQAAGVNEEKVFPHNLRHLFARSFYAIERNISHLADILGHSSIETTRIYVAASARTCKRTMDKMQLVI